MPDLKLTDGTRTIMLRRPERMYVAVDVNGKLYFSMHVPGQPDVWLDESDHRWMEVAE